MQFNRRFSVSQQRKTSKRLCSSEFRECHQVFAASIEPFTGYQRTYRVPLNGIKRVTQNRLYENECIESSKHCSVGWIQLHS